METYDIIRELITNLVWIQQEIDDNGGPSNWENAEMNLQYSDMRFKILDSVGLDDTRENIKLCYADNLNCEDEEDREIEIDKILHRLYRAAERARINELNYAYLEV